MTQGIPSYMNAEFMQGVLRRSEQDETIEVIDMHSKQGTDKGDNYCSDIYRILVELTRKKADKKISEKKSILVKLAPREESSRRDMIEKSEFFLVETEMMTNTLEKMNKITGKNHRFNATVYYVERKYPGYLILEDLAARGFCMAHRLSGLDLDHCLLTMRNLAKFHASSAVLCEREPNQKHLYRRGMFSSEYPEELRVFFTCGTKVLGDEIERWPELGPKYAKKIKAMSENAYVKGIATVQPRDDEFNVLNHGDAWVNNMLFRYDDEGKPVDHVFVDFQMSMYTSPAIDLHYFLSTSPSPKVYNESKQSLLEEYLRTLTSCLKEFGYKGAIPTMDVLQRHLQEREFYAVMASFMILPIVLLEKEKAVGLDEMMQEDGTYTNPGYKGEAYRKLMTERIPYFDKRGLLVC